MTGTPRPQMVVLDGITLNPGDNPWTALLELGSVQLYDRTQPDQLVPRLSSADIALTNKVPIPGDALRQLPNLKLIAVTATGHDCVDTVAAREQGIPVCNVPTYGTDSVAQFTFALLLELCHRTARHDQAVREGQWSRCGSFSFWLTPQVELAGLTLGIIGYGRIGRRVAEIGRAFGMQILAARHESSSSSEAVETVELNELAARSDVITLHCGFNEQSREMINASFLSRVKPSAFLINTARGGLIQESALAEALNSDRLAGAGLDVVSVEPIQPENPLLTAKNCILTPHLAWSSRAARRRMMQTVVDNIRCFLAGHPVNIVNGPF